MVSRKQRGYSLLEVVVALAVFAIFLFILATLTAEMRSYEQRLPVNMHRHPQVMAVMSRLRRDVLDSTEYKSQHDGYVSSSKVLIVETVIEGGVQTVVWDFSNAGEVRRRAYNVGVPTQWVARGLPADFASIDIDAIRTNPGSPWAARIQARDSSGKLAIDSILQPRATE